MRRQIKKLKYDRSIGNASNAKRVVAARCVDQYINKHAGWFDPEFELMSVWGLCVHVGFLRVPPTSQKHASKEG